MNEAEICRTHVRPKLEAAGWDRNEHFFSEQTAFIDGRIIIPSGKPWRIQNKFSDFLLRYTRNSGIDDVSFTSTGRSWITGPTVSQLFSGSLETDHLNLMTAAFPVAPIEVLSE